MPDSIPTFADFPPKTRKEFYMAIMAGGNPGRDFPFMGESSTSVVSANDTTFNRQKSGDFDALATYKAELDAECPANSDVISVKMDGENIEFASLSGAEDEANSGKCQVSSLFDSGTITVYYFLPRDGGAGSSFDADLEITFSVFEPVQPKTNIEKYLAYAIGLYDGELPYPKTSKEFYIGSFFMNFRD